MVALINLSCKKSTSKQKTATLLIEMKQPYFYFKRSDWFIILKHRVYNSKQTFFFSYFLYFFFFFHLFLFLITRKRMATIFDNGQQSPKQPEQARPKRPRSSLAVSF